MNWWTRLLAWLGGDRLREAMMPPAATGIDRDEHLWRPLTNRNLDDLPPWHHQRMLEVALYLDRHNLLAKRILDLLRDFVVAEGLAVRAANRQVQDWLDRHWHDPVNQWPLRGPRAFRMLLRDGELLLTAGVNPVDGMVRWGTIPARRIKDVRPHPDNWELVEEIVLYPDNPGDSERVLRAIAQRPGQPRMDGEALFERINDDGLRGISVLYPAADLLDSMSTLLYNDIERQQLLKAFVWDVTVAGATPQELQRLVKTDPSFQPPRPGSVRVHNDQVTWQAIAPELRIVETTEGMRFLRNFIAAGEGIPEHWLGEGGDVNRAVGTVMDAPTIKHLTHLQRIWGAILTRAMQFVVDQAVLHGSLPPQVPVENARGEPVTDEQGQTVLADPRDLVRVEFPDMDTADQKDLATVLSQVMTALVAAEGRYLSAETARRLVALILGQFGIAVDPAHEAQLIEQERLSDAQNQELPPAVRQAFEQALASPNGSSP